MHNLLSKSRKALESVQVGKTLTQPSNLRSIRASAVSRPSSPSPAAALAERETIDQGAISDSHETSITPDTPSSNAETVDHSQPPLAHSTTKEHLLVSPPSSQPIQTSLPPAAEYIADTTPAAATNQDRQVPAVVISHSRLTAGSALNIIVGHQTLHEGAPILIQLKTILEPIPAAHDSRTAETDQRSRCFEGTRVQLLSEIENWVMGQGNTASIFVLDGVAGIGKTTVAQTIAERAALAGILGASFFFSRNEEERRSGKHFFSTICFQLARYNEAFAGKIEEALKKNPDATQKTLLQQFNLLILQPLQSLLSHDGPPILLVIDALDECEEEDAKIVLSTLVQEVHNLPQFKIFTTSRPEWHIRDVLDRDDYHERFHLHEIEDSVVHSDIELYLRFSLSANQVQRTLPRLHPPWEPSNEEMTILCGLCGTLFIIAATAAKFILDNKRSDPRKQLGRLFDGISLEDFSGSRRTDVMDKMYLQILRSAAPEDLDEDDDWIRAYQTIVGAIIILQNPLPCRALAILLDIDPSTVENTLFHLHSLVAPSGDDLVFRIHHKSFPDFITDKDRISRALSASSSGDDVRNITRQFLIDSKSHHRRMAKECFRIMLQLVKENVGNIGAAQLFRDTSELEHLGRRFATPELAYACTQWASHLKEGGIDGDLRRYLESWTSKQIMAWLELLSIIEQTDTACHSLDQASRTIAHVDEWEARALIQELLADTWRFVQRNNDTLKLSPLQIYHSGLPFTPPETAIYRHYQGLHHLKLRAISGIEHNWGPAIATLVGHKQGVLSVAFSNDGLRLATASVDQTIQLWDAVTGINVATITGHTGVVNCVAFSGASARLASASDDCTVQIWNGRTGAHIATLRGHSSGVNAVAFSSSGLQLVSGSADSTIRLWDAIRGTHVGTVSGHSEAVNSVAISPDGLKFASASDDHTVRIWAWKSLSPLFTVCEHSDRVQCVAFSPDGLRLASGSSDQTIRLWDATTGSSIATLQGHSGEISSLAFSSNSSMLASASYDRSVLLWDPQTSSQIATLGRHSSQIRSVAFSNDGSRVASASEDHLVQLWDGRITTSTLPVDSHSSIVAWISFSPDGSKFATASADHTICIWDGESGARIATIHGHSDLVRSVAFCGDGSRLASGSHDQSVRLWDGGSGVHIATLNGHSDRIISVAFTYDGSRIASASNDHTIRLWDGRSGEHVATLEGHSKWVMTVAFSRDGSRLVSGAFDDTVCLWNGQTGASIATLNDHSNKINYVTFNGNSMFASVSIDKTVRFWEGKTGSHVSTFSSEAFAVLCITFCFDSEDDASESDRILMLVRRYKPGLTGLVSVKQMEGGRFDVTPLCWFPPQLVVGASFTANRSGSRVAVGCRTGRTLLLDISGLSIP